MSIDKGKFGKSTVEYLRYSVSESGIRPLKRKLDALEKFKQSQTPKDVLHFCDAIKLF